jgi:hypothetical protein
MQANSDSQQMYVRNLLVNDTHYDKHLILHILTHVLESRYTMPEITLS